MFEPNKDIDTIVDIFAEKPVGGIVTFDEISHRLGFNIRKHLYLVQLAKSRYEKRYARVLRNVRNIGYVCKAAIEYADNYLSARKSARLKYTREDRKVRHALKAHNEQLPPDAAKRLSHEMAVAGIMIMQLQDRHVSKLSATDSKPPSHAEVAKRTLEMWNKKV